MSETKTKLSAWTGRVVILSLLLFFFAVPHTLEDFALGEPAKNGVPAVVLSFVVAGMFALQGLALFWAGQKDRRSYFIHAGLGIFWPLAAGIAQLPVILRFKQLPLWIYLGGLCGGNDCGWHSCFF